MRANLPGHGLTTAQRSICAMALCVLSACATRLDPAPVTDLSAHASAPAPTPVNVAPVAPAPVVLAPARPGYYRVQPGDTLLRIARSNGRSDHDLVAWNNLADANHIEVNQLLRVAPPASANAASADEPAPVSAPAPTSAPDNGVIALSWPVHGPLLGRFDDTRNKGIDIGGKPGEPVRAAASGRVVYAGNGLRGYGNLVIVKSDAAFLTAYAHNRNLKVKEGDSVTKGEEIAEMGKTDADRVMLHFEVRHDGKPVDPLRYLPPQ
ncbi:peptidoglycan DD-metalloendopeptidase family protein [Paraburkholderia denitrificans]|uniref:Peptidoglycan DD-metalloendopeptidase family protein n=1 Tax=Paraburkholderia denitrificans TaxID=694025 RepID=A0ABW0J353_9BURK